MQFGPTSAQWCSDELLGAIAEASARSGRRVHMHLLETKYQRAFADRAYPGGLLPHLKSLGFLSERIAFAHCVYARPDELALIAEAGATIVTNPSSNLHLASGIAPIDEAIKKGVRVACGVDGSALDEDDDALREMRLGHFLHGGWGFDKVIERAPYLAAIVANGRRANGAPGRGEIKVGEPADLLVLDLDRLDRDAVTPVDPIDLVFARANQAHVAHLFVAGKTIVRDGKLLGADLDQIHAQLRDETRRAMPGRASFLTAYEELEAECHGVLLWYGRMLLRPDSFEREKSPMDQLPVIDLAGLSENDGAALERIAAEIGRACREIGFFYIVNHAVAAQTIAAAFAQSALFFALPIEAKRVIAIEKIGGNRGYSGLMHEALDPGKAADLKEAFNVGLEIAADDPDLSAGKPFRSLNAWPDLPHFRATLLGYFAECAKLGGRLHRAFATDLGLNPNFFANKFDRPMATLRLLHYPPTPPDALDGQLGAGEHTDYGNVTLLATDSVGGLEVRTRAGAWIAAPVVPGAFIVNIGDCLMRWTNNVYVSTPHRVVNRSGRERYSIAFFFDPNPDALVAAIPSCVPAGAEPLYPPIEAADHLRARLAASTAHVRG